MKSAVRIDSLVRGPVGFTDRIETMRVFAVDAFGHASGINGEGKQSQMHAGTYEVIDGPRPVRERTDIPERLRA